MFEKGWFEKVERVEDLVGLIDALVRRVSVRAVGFIGVVELLWYQGNMPSETRHPRGREDDSDAHRGLKFRITTESTSANQYSEPKFSETLEL